jgi:hypothetical protein
MIKAKGQRLINAGTIGPEAGNPLHFFFLSVYHYVDFLGGGLPSGLQLERLENLGVETPVLARPYCFAVVG